MTQAATIPELVRTAAQEIGFHLAGIAPVPGKDDNFPELRAFSQWVDEGRAGEMEYLKRRDESGELLRSSLQVPFPWARSVIVCAVNYNARPHSDSPPTPDNSGKIARYARSGRRKGPASTENAPDASGAAMEPTDYHAVVMRRLEMLVTRLRGPLGDFTARCYVDTGPLVERVYAKYAGLGWLGKNTCLLHETYGPWLFLGVVVTSLELPPGAWPRLHPDRCGSCTRCLDACPTHCLEPYRMDASRCIAYLTIEKRGEIAESLRPYLGNHVFGCDICQEVCPWGRRAPVTDWPELAERPELAGPPLEWLRSLDENQFRALFGKSPLARTKHAGLQRNVAIAIQNIRSAGPER
jgi:epoxyqueuosine reductase